MNKTWTTLESICSVHPLTDYTSDERDELLSRVLEILGDDIRPSQRERLDDAVYCFNVMRGRNAEDRDVLP